MRSWNDGAAKQAIVKFVQVTTDQSSPNFVPPEQRVATFDQDGTLWVEHPLYTQLVFALDRVAALAPKHPEWKNTQPFQTVLSGDKAAIGKLTMKDLEAIVMATHTGMTVDQFQTIVKDWIYLLTGRHSKAAFGNSTGDRQMLEYTQAGGGAPLMMMVLHDDPKREYAYGPAKGLPDSKVGTFTQAPNDEAKSKGWIVISMKDDWKTIFPFDAK